ncbi:MAG TPA: S41 family peptidase [Saprospiraceae bacterium]|nr:peptidase S41 [Saprospiraceae bacterium]HRG41945.1 S41 family peptidase [Saprospiraceae bacterium]
MKTSILTSLILFFAISIYCQNEEIISKLNFDFETVENGNPKGWKTSGSPNYLHALDSTQVFSGKYAVSVEFKEGSPDFKAWSFTIPNNYAGKKITLEAHIKTENVTEGYAGLWMGIDPSIAFDNMKDSGVKGTTDWTKYKISLEMNPEKTKQIVFGGLLVGKGKMWIDNFRVSIDGKDIKELHPFENKLFPALNDKAFDQGSGITSVLVDKNQIGNLKTLGLIWGFLKYYHPNIAKGAYNWDYELFRILPKVLHSNNKSNLDSILVKWINGLGDFPQGKNNIIKAAEVKIEPDLDWIKDSGFSDELRAILLKVKNANRSQEHYYIGLKEGTKNPDFKNENAYPSMKYPDLGFRLLTLYRYWNIIQYYFPYKNLIEEDWKNVLEEFIPKFIAAKDEKEYTLVTLEIIGRVHDTHANIWGENQVLKDHFGQRYACVELTFIDDKPVVKDFYDEQWGKETGLEIGDIISVVNNRPVEEIVQEKLKYSPASNYPTKLRDMAFNLLRTNDTIIQIEYIREDKKYNKILKTYSSNEINIYSNFYNTDTCFKLIDKDIAYLNNGSLKRKYLPEIWKSIEHTKGLIIDIRNYPTDFVIYDLSDYLMPDSIQFVKITNGSIETPGLFAFDRTLYVGKENKNYYKGKVVILVNELTQSSSEFHAMAYRLHPKATVIGSTTAGSDGNISQFSLPGAISSVISGIGIYYPDGRETQRVGIVPDIEVKPTILGLMSGQDEVLNKAIEIIQGTMKK